ncbi:hypothetical protein IFM89_033557 [Coptis chinensis]|uniref:Thymidylate kinase-like domain-containing protein n=1 Tax=Coptis chinensis TaxID=261450 RepID=A0A835HAA3_9MAGN|nr:hypothetical protein IFM89_033557 [Coptis chinensis]
MKNFNSGSGGISLASKRCPSLDSTFDKTTLLCESIARRVFPRESYAEYEGLEEAHYAYRVRDHLRKEVSWRLENSKFLGKHISFISRIFGTTKATRPSKFQLNFAKKTYSTQIRMEDGQIDNQRGALVVLEGLDRSGKTSQCNRLLSFLEGLGFSVESWRFPDRKAGVGEMISSYLANKSQLDDRAIHLLFSANHWEKRFVLFSFLHID